MARRRSCQNVQIHQHPLKPQTLDSPSKQPVFAQIEERFKIDKRRYEEEEAKVEKPKRRKRNYGHGASTNALAWESELHARTIQQQQQMYYGISPWHGGPFVGQGFEAMSMPQQQHQQRHQQQHEQQHQQQQQHMIAEPQQAMVAQQQIWSPAMMPAFMPVVQDSPGMSAPMPMATSVDLPIPTHQTMAMSMPAQQYNQTVAYPFQELAPTTWVPQAEAGDLQARWTDMRLQRNMEAGKAVGDQSEYVNPRQLTQVLPRSESSAAVERVEVLWANGEKSKEVENQVLGQEQVLDAPVVPAGDAVLPQPQPPLQALPSSVLSFDGLDTLFDFNACSAG
ncbi:hypothetical protein N0V94_005539 [Neodidymelliopsis sp. IMI 364377]|nr:hypothetical protein N0V94_005539 [Neodidymelliopsis sp. IMI 364377]